MASLPAAAAARRRAATGARGGELLRAARGPSRGRGECKDCWETADLVDDPGRAGAGGTTCRQCLRARAMLEYASGGQAAALRDAMDAMEDVNPGAVLGALAEALSRCDRPAGDGPPRDDHAACVDVLRNHEIVRGFFDDPDNMLGAASWLDEGSDIGHAVRWKIMQLFTR